jgi:hypothetical protein
VGLSFKHRGTFLSDKTFKVLHGKLQSNDFLNRKIRTMHPTTKIRRNHIVYDTIFAF